MSYLDHEYRIVIVNLLLPHNYYLDVLLLQIILTNLHFRLPTKVIELNTTPQRVSHYEVQMRPAFMGAFNKER